MKILVTAGNTQTPLDRVRCITNIFTGQTGTRIALEANRRGHDVCLLTSHPELATANASGGSDWDVRFYRTFDELHALIAAAVPTGEFDAIVHCAAVSDYQLAGVFAPTDGLRLVDVSAGKVKSSHKELWLKLVPTPKLVDRIRTDWSFDGVLVKFKLEVDVTERELAFIAAAARLQSDADLIVANTLDGMHHWALMVDCNSTTERIARAELSARLLDEIELLHRQAACERECIVSADALPYSCV